MQDGRGSGGRRRRNALAEQAGIMSSVGIDDVLIWVWLDKLIPCKPLGTKHQKGGLHFLNLS